MGAGAVRTVARPRGAAEQTRELTLVMGRLLRDLRAMFDDVASEHGLTPSLADFLWQITPEQSLTMRSAAELISCDPSNVTFLADRLEDRGLLERRLDPSDRRIKLLALTDEGERLRQRLFDASVERSPFATLTAQERAQLMRLLTKVAGCSESLRSESSRAAR